MVQAERFEPAIRERVWFLTHRPDAACWYNLLLKSGSAVLEGETGEVWLEGAALFVAPSGSDWRIRLSAGSDLVQCVAPAGLVTSAIGHGPDAAETRALVEHALVADLADDSQARQMVDHAFALFLREAGRREPGSDMLIEAGVKTLLAVVLRRLSDPDLRLASPSRSNQHLQKFRQLLETHFRGRWTVAQYAGAMGIGADRLHDLCTVSLGKNPSRLIQDRSNYEARVMLSNTALTVGQISQRLGYRDPSHFSKSFRKMSGLSPGAFRKELRTRDLGQDRVMLDYADWP